MVFCGHLTSHDCIPCIDPSPANADQTIPCVYDCLSCLHRGLSETQIQWLKWCDLGLSDSRPAWQFPFRADPIPDDSGPSNTEREPPNDDRGVTIQPRKDLTKLHRMVRKSTLVNCVSLRVRLLKDLSPRSPPGTLLQPKVVNH
jgi:hypothetical protein